jgi:hypothetical protein
MYVHDGNVLVCTSIDHAHIRLDIVHFGLQYMLYRTVSVRYNSSICR